MHMCERPFLRKQSGYRAFARIRSKQSAAYVKRFLPEKHKNGAMVDFAVVCAY